MDNALVILEKRRRVFFVTLQPKNCTFKSQNRIVTKVYIFL